MKKEIFFQLESELMNHKYMWYSCQIKKNNPRPPFLRSFAPRKHEYGMTDIFLNWLWIASTWVYLSKAPVY